MKKKNSTSFSFFGFSQFVSSVKQAVRLSLKFIIVEHHGGLNVLSCVWGVASLFLLSFADSHKEGNDCQSRCENEP